MSVARTVGGLAMVVAGATLLYQSLSIYDERLKASMPKKPPTAQVTTTAPPTAKPTASPAAATAKPSATASASSSASASASPSAAPSASAAASASAAPKASAAPSADAGDAAVFHFGPGGIVMAKDELARAVAYGGSLRKQDRPKITVEGFGDEAGDGDKGTFLGRRRATIVRQLFGDIGIDGERIIIAPVDVATDASLAGSVRIRSTTPEGKAP